MSEKLKHGKNEMNSKAKNPILMQIQTQLSDVRRYVKVWIKQEQVKRNKSAVTVQKCIRGFLCRKHSNYTKHKFQVVHVSSNMLMHSLDEWGSCILRIQAMFRGFIMRKRIRHHIKVHKSARAIQATWRMHSLKDGLMLKMYCGQAKINSMNAQSATKVLCKHLQLLNHKVAEMRTEQSISNEALKMLWSEVAELRKGAS